MSNLRIMQIRSDLKQMVLLLQIIQIATELNQKIFFNIVIYIRWKNLSTLMKRNITYVKVPEINIKKRNLHNISCNKKKLFE